VATVFEVRDELWEVVEPMIPPVSMPARQGRPAGARKWGPDPIGALAGEP
jgi:hypothetical protein